MNSHSKEIAAASPRDDINCRRHCDPGLDPGEAISELNGGRLLRYTRSDERMVAATRLSGSLQQNALGAAIAHDGQCPAALAIGAL